MWNKYIYFSLMLVVFAGNRSATAQILSQNFEGNSWTPTAYVIGTTGTGNTTIPSGVPANTPASQVWTGGIIGGTGAGSNDLWHRSDYQGAWSTSNDICTGTYKPPTCGANGTSHSLLFDGYDAPSGSQGYVQSPQMDLSPYCTATLTFYYYNYDESTLAVQFWNGSSWVSAATLGNTGNSWTLETITVPTSCLINGTMLAFTAVSAYEFYPIGIDEIVITGTGGGPSNDACASPTALTSGVSTAGTDICATSSGTDPVPGCKNSGCTNTVWYTLTIAASSSITVNVTHGTISHAAASLYAGSCGTLSELNCSSPGTTNGNPSFTSSCLAAGTYYIMVWNDGGSTGTFTINATATACTVSNDNCPGIAIPTANLNGTWNTGYTTSGASNDGTDSPYNCYTNNDWFSFVAQGPDLEITVTSGSNCEPEIALFSNNPCSGSGTLIGAATLQSCLAPHYVYNTISLLNNNSSYGYPSYFTLTNGQTYYFSVTSKSGCSYSVQVNNPSNPNPPGTDCATAQILCAGGTYGGAASLWGTQELTTSTIYGCNLDEEINSSWFVLNVLSGGTLTFTLNPSDGIDDYDYAIYSGATCTLGAPITCNYSDALGVTGISTASGGTSNSTGATGITWNKDLNVTTGGVYLLYINGFTPSSGNYNFTFGGTAVLGCTLPTILPVDLLEYKADYDGKNVNVTWATATETNSKSFIVEKSTDAQNYHSLAEIKAAGNSTTERKYKVVDDNPYMGGVSYYRLKQVDMNGQSRTYDAVPIYIVDGNTAFNVKPNPTKNSAEISYQCFGSEQGTIRIIDYTGKLIYTDIVNCTKGLNNYTVNLTDSPSGVYFITLSTSNKVYKTKLIKE